MSERSVTVDLDLKRADFLANVDRLADRIEGTKTAAELLAEIRTRQTRADRAHRAALLNSGEWTPAGGGLEIRIHEARPC